MFKKGFVPWNKGIKGSKKRGNCKVEGCIRKHYGKGYCSLHHNRLKRTGSVGSPNPIVRIVKKCSMIGCNRRSHCKGYCDTHYTRLRKWGDASYIDKGPNGKGFISNYGYRYISVNGKKKFEHRHIMEQYLGRELLKTENVHHKNGDKLDNRIDNLELWSSKQPMGQRIEDKISYAKEILELYDTPDMHRLLKIGESVNEKSGIH